MIELTLILMIIGLAVIISAFIKTDVCHHGNRKSRPCKWCDAEIRQLQRTHIDKEH